MNDQETARVEIEGGGWNWFFVCDECHGAVEYKAEKCPQCGRRLNWDEQQQAKSD